MTHSKIAAMVVCVALSVCSTVWAGGYQGGIGISKLGSGNTSSYGGSQSSGSVLYYPPNYGGGNPATPGMYQGGMRRGTYRNPDRLGPAPGGYGSYGYGNSYYYSNRYYIGSETAYPRHVPNSGNSYGSPSYGFQYPLNSSGTFRHYTD